MTRDLRKILKMLAEKYSGSAVIVIYDDESGRITREPTMPYLSFEYSFGSIDELVEHLQEKTNDTAST